MCGGKHECEFEKKEHIWIEGRGDLQIAGLAAQGRGHVHLSIRVEHLWVARWVSLPMGLAYKPGVGQ